MDAQEYCAMVEDDDQQHKKLLSTMHVAEDKSRFIGLKHAGFHLMFEPSIRKHYKYLVREAVAEKLGRISRLLQKDDKVLVIRSVWRSFDHQRLLWENRVRSLQQEFPESELNEIHEIVSHYIAEAGKSMHSTGGAVDALIFDEREDRVLDFGTNDGLKINLNTKCYPYHPDITPRAKANRKLLIDLFEQEDFVVDRKEYWHFDYGNVSWAIDKKKNQAIYGMVESHAPDATAATVESKHPGR